MNAVICGGTNNTINYGNSFIGGGGKNTIIAVYGAAFNYGNEAGGFQTGIGRYNVGSVNTSW